MDKGNSEAECACVKRSECFKGTHDKLYHAGVMRELAFTFISVVVARSLKSRRDELGRWVNITICSRFGQSASKSKMGKFKKLER